jgi:hypothetical protein
MTPDADGRRKAAAATTIATVSVNMSEFTDPNYAVTWYNPQGTPQPTSVIAGNPTPGATATRILTAPFQLDVRHGAPLAANRWYHVALRVTRVKPDPGAFAVEVFLDGASVYTKSVQFDRGNVFLRGAEVYTSWWGAIDDLDSSIPITPSVWWDELSIDPPPDIDLQGLYRTFLQQGLGNYANNKATWFDYSGGYNDTNLLHVGANNDVKSLLRFDLSNIPADVVIDEATLALFYTGRSNGNTLTLGAHGVLADWDQGVANRTQRQTGVNWQVAGMAAGSDVEVVDLPVGVTALSAGGAHTCAVIASGGAKCWGRNWDGQVGAGSTADFVWRPVDVMGLTTGVTGITAGYLHTCATLASGAAQCWGWNGDSQLGDGTTITRRAPVDVWALAYDCASVTDIPQPECQALVTFFEATNGPLWQERTDWLHTPMPCRWWGVTCAGGHVSQPALPANRLEGALPAALGDLAALQRLDLSGNALDGPLPAALGQLTVLQMLDLSNSGLAGVELPSELGALTALRTRDLSSNALSGPIPAELGALTALRTLDLHGNTLSGPIPPELGALSALQTLDLSANHLTGALPAALAHINGLQGLNVTANQLRGPAPRELLSGTAPYLSAQNNLLELYDRTQTLPPRNVQVSFSAPDTVTLTWSVDPAVWLAEVSSATAPEGPFTVHGMGYEAYTVAGLLPNVRYYFRLRTFTAAHQPDSPQWGAVFNHAYFQQSNLWSDYVTVTARLTPVQRWLPLIVQ